MSANMSAAVVSALTLAAGSASGALLDFEEFANGEQVFASMGVTISDGGVGPGLGPAAFDSTPGGPNAGGSDTDLLVGLGNVLIVQNDAFSAQTTPGTFDEPNDEEGGGQIDFDFASPQQMLSIDMVDINSNGPAWVRLFDSQGESRVYFVPLNWTFDVLSQPMGWDTLDLTSTSPQLGEGGTSTTVTETSGFDPLDVVRLEVEFDGSAGLDNLSFIPAPGTVAMLGGLALIARRRRA
ncbi:MAG: hypothetical protein AAGD00_05480 [Planctomycetota bacterium]